MSIVEIMRLPPTRSKQHMTRTYILSGHPATPPLVSVGDPLMKTPNSFNNGYDVMKTIMTTYGVGEHREWTTVGCDGLPCGIVAHIIENYFGYLACSHDIQDWQTNFCKASATLTSNMTLTTAEHITYRYVARPCVRPFRNQHGYFQTGMACLVV
jgi:hypothetical protein